MWKSSLNFHSRTAHKDLKEKTIKQEEEVVPATAGECETTLLPALPEVPTFPAPFTPAQPQSQSQSPPQPHSPTQTQMQTQTQLQTRIELEPASQLRPDQQPHPLHPSEPQFQLQQCTQPFHLHQYAPPTPQTRAETASSPSFLHDITFIAAAPLTPQRNEETCTRAEVSDVTPETGEGQQALLGFWDDDSLITELENIQPSEDLASFLLMSDFEMDNFINSSAQDILSLETLEDPGDLINFF